MFPLLEWLSQECFSRGVYKHSLDTLLCDFINDVWLKAMAKRLSQLASKEVDLLGWLLFQTVSAGEELGTEARKFKLEMVPFITILQKTNPRLAGQLSAFLGPSVATSALGSSKPRTIADVRNVPGGRHSNDHVQFRDIELLPSEDEINCQTEPYLPLPNSVYDEATLLDRSFRLLRHDFVSSIRAEFGNQPLKNEKRNRHTRVFPRAEVSQFVSGLMSRQDRENQRDAGKKNMMIAGVTRGYFVLTFQHPKGKEKRASKQFWEDHPKMLQRDALLCLTRNNQPICFAVVCERDTNLLGSNTSQIGILPSSFSACRTLVRMLMERHQFDLVQCSANFFSVEHVLRGLKRMKEIPFTDELVAWKVGDSYWAPEFIRDSAYQSVVNSLRAGQPVNTLIKSLELEKIAAQGGQLDASQSAAILRGLSTRVALIQGPPGTFGKRERYERGRISL